MPPFVRYLETQKARGGALVVIDPRRSATAQLATLHLQPMPGTDTALANGLLHVLLRDGLANQAYIERRTEGFAKVRAVAAGYWPELVERVTGVPEKKIVEAARLLGTSARGFVLTGRGPEQQSQGVANALSYINIALACGFPGTEGSGFGILTGQGNGQGGREHGQKADQLPGYRSISDPAARRAVAGVWRVSPDSLPGPGKSAYELLQSCGTDGGVRALFVMGFNALVSSPAAHEVEARLASLDFLAVSDFFLSETARMADVVLPSAQWAEEDGTMTNLEGRVIRRKRAVAAPIGVASDIGVLVGLAERLGKRRHFTYGTPEDVFNELARATKGAPADYSGITYAKIDAQRGVFWPCPSAEHTGTPRLFLDAFATPSGKARFHPVKHKLPAETPDKDYPLFLTTGRVLAQYQSGTMTRRVPALNAMSGTAVAELHPQTAARLKVDRRRPDRREDAPRLGRRHRQGDARHPPRHRLHAVPLARRAVGQSPHHRRARSDEPHAGVQGLRGARGPRVERQRQAPRVHRTSARTHAHDVTSSSRGHRQRHGGRPPRRRRARPRQRRSLPRHHVRRRAVRQLQPHPALGRARRHPAAGRHLHQPARLVHRERRDAARRHRRGPHRPRGEGGLRLGRPGRALRHAGHRHRLGAVRAAVREPGPDRAGARPTASPTRTASTSSAPSRTASACWPAPPT